MWHVKPLPLHVSRWDIKLRSHECFLKTASLFLGVTELSVRLLLDDLFDGRKEEDDITADLCLRGLPAALTITDLVTADDAGNTLRRWERRSGW